MNTEPTLHVQKRVTRGACGRARVSVNVRAEVHAKLYAFLNLYMAHELILQKPVIFGSLPIDMHRDHCGLPTNTHILSFLQDGQTIVITIGSLLNGYTFETESIWDSMAFLAFAENAFERFKRVCEYVSEITEDDAKPRPDERDDRPVDATLSESQRAPERDARCRSKPDTGTVTSERSPQSGSTDDPHHRHRSRPRVFRR